MKKLLLFASIFFLLIGITTNAQSTFTDEQSQELPYFQNEQIISKNKIEIFPNPASEFIYIKINNSEFENIEMELFNIIGNSLSFELEEIEKNSYRIKVEDFPPGYYLLMIKDPIKRFNQAFKFHKVK
jgi:hypothetical protein